MSRADRVVARNLGAKRPQRIKLVYENRDGYRIIHRQLTAPNHQQGDSWWREKYADLVERRLKNEPRKKKEIKPAPVPKKPSMLPRPPGMTRQMHRRLYREACKLAGVPWRNAV